MPTVRYTVIDGEVIAEKRSGVRKEYVPDPLGSTVALLDNSQSVTDSFSYWPYGEEQTRTGSTQTPFEFVGTMGYYRDSASKTYVRARYLDVKLGRWMTQDPIWFGGGNTDLFVYVANRPSVLIDPSGYRPYIILPLTPHPVQPKDPRFPYPPAWNPLDYAICAACLKQNESCIRGAGKKAYDEEYKRFPHTKGSPPTGDQNGPPDAFRHCTWACETVKNCGPGVYNCGVLGHERNVGWGHWSPVSSPMDLANDEVGRKCNGQNSSCSECCYQKFITGQLYVLPIQYWSPQ